MNDIKIDRLIRTKRRTIGLQIAQDASLIVRAPYFVTLRDLKNVLKNKRDWILKKQNLVRSRIRNQRDIKFISGDELFYLGDRYAMEFSDEASDVMLAGHKIYIPSCHASHPREKLIQWYKTEAWAVISERVSLIARTANITYKTVKISRAKRRWGSCGVSGNLNFNWRLIMAPLYVLDYVVVHELVHIKIRNHSSDFWRGVAAIYPHYKEPEKWLKENHWALDI